MGATSPRLSVVIPLFNGVTYVMQAAQSILDQTLADLELIVVDDASDDNGPRLVSECGDPRVRMVRLDHNGTHRQPASWRLSG